MIEPLQYAFFQRALLAGLLASVACGMVGTYVVVKRFSSISGGLAHAAFGGVGLGYFLGFDPMLGATGFAIACGALLGYAYRRMQTGLDTLISILWSTGMAIGIVFISLTPGFVPDLMSYLFGNILVVPPAYVRLTGALDLVIIVIVLLLYKEFQAVAFDEQFAEMMGVRVGPIFQLLLVLTACAVVTLMRVVGVILVIALLTVPAAIGRQWSESMRRMMVLAVLIGAFCTTFGLYLSYWLSDWFDLNVPTGPLIILIAILLYGLSGLIRSRIVRSS